MSARGLGVRGVVVALLLLVGCGRPSGTLRASVDEHSRHVFTGTGFAVEVGGLDPQDEVVLTYRDEVIARGPIGYDEGLPAALPGRACQLQFSGWYDGTSTTYNPALERPTSRDLRTRTYRGVNVQITCADGPVPGTDAATPGAQALPAFAGVLALLLLGGLVATLAARERWGWLLLSLLLGAAGAVALAVLLADGTYVLSYLLAYLGFAVIGAILGHVAHEGHRVPAGSATVAALVGGFAPALAWARWSPGGPVLALVLGALAGLVTLVAALTVTAPTRTPPGP